MSSRPLTTLAGTFLAMLIIVGASPALGARLSSNTLLAPAGRCAGGDNAQASATAKAASMRCLFNYALAQSGRTALASSAVLTRAATIQVAANLRCGDYSHEPCGMSFRAHFSKAGARYYHMGENLDLVSADATPRDVMFDWLNSPEHRTILLEPYFGLAGFAASPAGDGVSLWAAELGSKR